MNSKNLFIELELSDIKLKIRELIATQSRLKVWNSSELVESFNVIELNDNILKVNSSNVELDHEVLCNFSLREMSYFFKANYDRDNSSLSVVSNIYRSERREDLRFNVSYMDASYIYFDISQETVVADNVLHFNKSKNSEDNFIRGFNDELSDLPELNGAKLIDISNSGASFIMTLQDFKKFSGCDFIAATLVIGRESFDLNNIESVYDVDYVNFRYDNIAMKKIGIKFNSNSNLDTYLLGLDDKSIVLTSLDEEFSKFVMDSRKG